MILPFLLNLDISVSVSVFLYSLHFRCEAPLLLLSLADLPTDDLLIQVVPKHFEFRHRLLDGGAVSLLCHLLQQEAGLVVQTLHLNL